jgi:serine/threonine protein kinase/tetratricopeptide (TPR) repeat protein
MAMANERDDGQDDPGTLIQRRYRLRERIGRGGMGDVWQAVDESLGRKVAVKCLKPLTPGADTTTARVTEERFRREARLAAALQHRGVTVVHDFGEHDGGLFLVMELLDGRNLAQLLEDNGGRPLPVPDITDIAEQVAAALAYTHERGIVHRDLKPANIIRLTDGAVKICDFGIARLGHDAGVTSRLTSTGIAVGTPHYMSPEQIGGGDDVDHRADLYSLGCVLYELATGAPPFDTGDSWAILLAHRDTVPEPPRSHRPDLPAELERLVQDLLAKDPDARPQNAADVAGRLKAMTRGTPFPGHPVPPPSRPGVSGPLASGPMELPSWAESITAGTRVPRGTPREGLPSELTGSWSALPAPHAPTPRPELLGVLAGRHDAAISLGRLGRWQEAESALRSVAAERAEILGPGHPDTLASQYEVGFCLRRLGRTEDALSAYQYVALARERALGSEHPDTLAVRQEVGYLLGRLGRHQEAHQAYVAVLAARERSQGPDHPETLRCRHNLAFSLARMGLLEESYVGAAAVAEARARVLGPAHPETLVTRQEVGYVLGRLGRWTEALDAYRQIAEARSGALGPEHPDTLAARYEAGIALGRLGRGAEAYELFRELVAARIRTVGPAHPETLRARHGLGVNLGRLGRWEEAMAEAREVAALRVQVLGPLHRDTLASKREAAVALGWLGRWAAALSVYRDIAEGRERALGADHPETLLSRSDEAHCLERLGRTDEALALYRRIAALRESVTRAS